MIIEFCLDRNRSETMFETKLASFLGSQNIVHECPLGENLMIQNALLHFTTFSLDIDIVPSITHTHCNDKLGLIKVADN